MSGMMVSISTQKVPGTLDRGIPLRLRQRAALPLQRGICGSKSKLQSLIACCIWRAGPHSLHQMYGTPLKQTALRMALTGRHILRTIQTLFRAASTARAGPYSTTYSMADGRAGCTGASRCCCTTQHAQVRPCSLHCAEARDYLGSTPTQCCSNVPFLDCKAAVLLQVVYIGA